MKILLTTLPFALFIGLYALVLWLRSRCQHRWTYPNCVDGEFRRECIRCGRTEQFIDDSWERR